jgi:multidrug efflux system membrane fusion protein
MPNKLHIDFEKPLPKKYSYAQLLKSRASLAIVLVLGIIFWMFSDDVMGIKNIEKIKKVTENNEKVFIVSAQTVQNQETYKVVRASGVLRPSFEIAIMSKKAGEVKEIFKPRGSSVFKDDLILTIDKGTLGEQLVASESNLKLAKKSFEISKNLSEKELRSELDTVRAEATYTSAKANVALINENIKNSEVRSRRRGLIEELEVEEGQFVKKNQLIGRIINLKEMLLYAPVAQTDISKISDGDDVIITVTGIGNRKGIVKRISSSASEATRTFSVEIEINNDDNSLKAGMSAEVGILVEKVKAFSISPAHLVIGEDGSLMVKTVKDNIVKEKVVSLVRTSGDFALISGLNDEELVLTTGQAFVNLGDKIEYKVD